METRNTADVPFQFRARRTSFHRYTDSLNSVPLYGVSVGIPLQECSVKFTIAVAPGQIYGTVG